MFQNNEENSVNNFGGGWVKPYRLSDTRERKRFWNKIWKQKYHNKKAEWINNMETELQMLEKSPQVNIHLDTLKVQLKRISNWKTPSQNGIRRFWLKKFTSIHDRLATEMHIKNWDTRMDNQREDNSNSKRPLKVTVHNVPTDDVKNTNGTNYREDLQLIDRPQNLPQGTERMLQENRRHRWTTIYR